MRLPLSAGLLLAGVASCPLGHAQSGSAISVEAGSVWQSRNNVQIPNSSEGTRFSLRDLQGGE